MDAKNVALKPGMTVLTDKGNLTHTARDMTTTVCGKNIWRLFHEDRPYWAPSCLICNRHGPR